MIQFDVWDYDGVHKQELAGYTRMTLFEALQSEGDHVYLKLKRMDHKDAGGKGVQAEGIKLAESGCLILKCFVSPQLRGVAESSYLPTFANNHNNNKQHQENIR